MNGKEYVISLIISMDVDGLLATGVCAHSSLVGRRSAALTATSTNLVAIKSRGANSNLKAPSPPFVRQPMIGSCSAYHQFPKPATLDTRVSVAGSYHQTRSKIE